MRKNRLTKNMKRAMGHLIKAAVLLSESEPEGPITQPIASISANAPVPGTSITPVTLEAMMARVLAAATQAISDALLVERDTNSIVIRGTNIEFVPMLSDDRDAGELALCLEGKIVTDVRDAIGEVFAKANT